jgi:hypothetical protein
VAARRMTATLACRGHVRERVPHMSPAPLAPPLVTVRQDADMLGCRPQPVRCLGCVDQLHERSSSRKSGAVISSTSSRQSCSPQRGHGGTMRSARHWIAENSIFAPQNPHQCGWMARGSVHPSPGRSLIPLASRPQPVRVPSSMMTATRARRSLSDTPREYPGIVRPRTGECFAPGSAARQCFARGWFARSSDVGRASASHPYRPTILTASPPIRAWL